MNIHLVLHGCVVLLLSQLAGYVLVRRINAVPRDAVRVDMWRMAHAACSAGAVFLIALGPVVPRLDFRPLPAPFVVATVVVSTYLFCLGSLIAGFSGHRGTRPGPPASNRAAYSCYLAGAITSTLTALALLYAALATVLTS